MGQFKQRAELITQLLNAMGGTKSSSGKVFEGALATPSPDLTFKNDPVILVDKITEVLKVVGMGALHLEQDTNLTSGFRPVLLPQRDHLTHLRFQFLYRVLPQGMTVTKTLTRKEPIEVFNTDGGPKVLIPIEAFTATDCLRLLVAEATLGSPTKNHARWALDNISLHPGESWQSAIHRLAQIFRAAAVDASRPALSEDTYFWRIIDSTSLHSLCDRAIVLCCKGSEDAATFRAVLMQRMDHDARTLQDHPVDMHALSSEGMARRGDVTRTCFYRFADFLGRNSIYYKTPTAGQPKTTTVHALGTRRSNRLPPGQDTFSLQLRQKGEVCALDEAGPYLDQQDAYSDDSEDLPSDSHLAAFPAAGTRPTGAPSTSQDTHVGGGRRGNLRRRDPTYEQRGNGTSYRRDNQQETRPNRRGPHHQDRPRAEGAPAAVPHKREAPQEPAGATTDRGTRRFRGSADRGTGASTATARNQQQLAADAPPPTAANGVIQKYIMDKRVCFDHARGVPCGRMNASGQCPYSHAHDIIPYGAYRRDRTTLSAFDDYLDENALHHASEVLAVIASADMATDDTAAIDTTAATATQEADA